MIRNYSDLKSCVGDEYRFYISSFNGSFKQKMMWALTHQHQYVIWKYVLLLRVEEYLLNSKRVRVVKMLLFWLLERMRNNIGNKIGFCIPCNVFAEGLFIDHIGSIIINPKVKVGKNCHIHGDCCIGLSQSSNVPPVLGDNVDIGWGAIIRGNIRIANKVTIGANAVVTKDIVQECTRWAGVPARMLI